MGRLHSSQSNLNRVSKVTFCHVIVVVVVVCSGSGLSSRKLPEVVQDCACQSVYRLELCATVITRTEFVPGTLTTFSKQKELMTNEC